MADALVQALIAHFDSVFEGPNGGYLAILEALDGVSVVQALWKPASNHNSIWQNVEHLIAGKDWQLEMLQYGQASAPYWVEPTGDGAAWHTSTARRKDGPRLLKIALEQIADVDLLEIPVPEWGRTLLSTGTAQEAHHGGQIDFLEDLQVR